MLSCDRRLAVAGHTVVRNARLLPAAAEGFGCTMPRDARAAFEPAASAASKTKTSLIPYLYIAPAMVVIVLIFGYPVYLNVRFSLMELTGFEGVFSGLRNYRILFEDNAFYQSLLHNIMLLALVPVLVFLCIVFATLLYERIRGWRIYRTVIFLPTVLGTMTPATTSVTLAEQRAQYEVSKPKRRPKKAK